MSNSNHAQAPAQFWGLACAAMLGLALVLGGGGSGFALPELTLEVVFACTFAVWAVRSGALPRVPGWIWSIAGITALIPLLQLVPLPPMLWQAMPGHDLQREALELIGKAQSWRAWSLAPDQTLASLLSLGPPLALMVMTSTLAQNQRYKLLAALCLVVLLSLIVGALQLSGGPEGPMRFYGRPDLVLTGFQINRNSTADVLLIAMVAVPCLVVELVRQNRFPPHPSYIVWTSLAGMALCLLGVVLTASRTGIVMVPIAMLGGALVLNTWLRLGWRKLATGGLAMFVLLALAGWILWNQTAIVHASSRFEMGRELRPELWRDGLYVVQQYFPFGIGVGNVVPALVAAERLEIVRETMPNRAHNDFLELAMEAGVFGLAAVSAIALTIVSAARRALKAGPGLHGQVIFALCTFILIGLHSAVDYPLRYMSLACLAGACTGMLARPRTGRSGAPGFENSMEQT